MTGHSPARMFSLRLMRLNNALLSRVDSLEGVKARSLRSLREDLMELVKEQDDLLSSFVDFLLSTTIDLLSAPSDSCTIPLTSLTTASSYLARAAEWVTNPPSTTTSSSSSRTIARLPTELLARVVHFVQDEPDPLLRQRTNAFLARSNRELNKLVQPILETEVAIGTPCQLEWFADKVKRAEKGDLSVKRVWVDLDLDEISRRDDGSWTGRRFLPTFIRLLKLVDLDLLHVNFRSDDACELDDKRKYRTTFGRAVGHALGLDDEDWWEFASSYRRSTFPNIADLQLPNMSASEPGEAPAVHELYQPPPALRRLRFGCSSPPGVSPPARMSDACVAYLNRLAEPGLGGTPLGFEYEVLAIPYHTCYPRHLLPLLRPPPPLLLPTIHHLEAAIRLDDLQQDVDDLVDAVSSLAPSLRRLVLRIEGRSAVFDTEHFTSVFGPALTECDQLEHLDIGSNLLHPLLLIHLEPLENLHHLALLSYSDEFQSLFSEVFEYVPPKQLTTLVLAVPGEQAVRSWCWSERDLRMVMEICEENKIHLRIEERPEEFAWLAARKDE